MISAAWMSVVRINCGSGSSDVKCLKYHKRKNRTPSAPRSAGHDTAFSPYRKSIRAPVDMNVLKRTLPDEERQTTPQQTPHYNSEEGKDSTWHFPHPVTESSARKPDSVLTNQGSPARCTYSSGETCHLLRAR